MDIPTLTSQIVKLLHTGQAWSRSIGTNLYNTVALLSPSIQRWYEFADTMLTECFPTTTVNNLDVWEASVGLPDPLFTGTMPAGLNRQLMIARISNTGGQSPSFYINYAALLGYQITIEETRWPDANTFFPGMRISQGYGDFHWIITVLNQTTFPFRAGWTVGEPIDITSDYSLLIYEITRLAPAHTVITWIAV